MFTIMLVTNTKSSVQVSSLRKRWNRLRFLLRFCNYCSFCWFLDKNVTSLQRQCSCYHWSYERTTFNGHCCLETSCQCRYDHFRTIFIPNSFLIAIAAIRKTGATNLILVPGNAWSGAHSWLQNWYGTPNATEMIKIEDPINNFSYELHQYYDSDFSGTKPECKDPKIGRTVSYPQKTCD